MTKHLTSIDLFAGCGGLSLGLEKAGFETVFVNELNADAMDSFLINRARNPYLKEKQNHSYDIMELTQNPKALEKLRGRLHKELGDIGIVCGGPPCQGYSGIGHRRTYKVDKKLGWTSKTASYHFKTNKENIIKYKFLKDGSRYTGYNLTQNSIKKIVLIGGSFAMGHGVNDEETFAYLLQKKLNR